VVCALAGCTTPELRQANRFADKGQWDQAVAAYQEAQRKAPFDEKIQPQLEQAKTAAAADHYALGKLAFENHRLADALHEFKLALGLDPSKADYHAMIADALRLKESQEYLQTAKKLQNLGRVEEALTALERAVELDPTQTTALDSITELTKQQRASKQMGDSQEPLTLRFQDAKLKEVFEILARTAGVNVLFDKEVRDDPITIFIKDLPFDEALHLILNTNGLIAQRVAPDTILVMLNNNQKQAQYQDLLMRTFYLANAKAKDAVNLVRTMLDSKKIYVDDKVNAIVVRDEPAKLQLAEKLLFAIDRRDPEVELDVEVLEVNRTKSLIQQEVRFINQLAEKRDFSWTQLLADLEEALPVGISIDTIHRDEKTATITLDGHATGMNTLKTLMTTLQTRPAFRQPVLHQHQLSDSSHIDGEEHETPGVEFSVTVQYRGIPKKAGRDDVS